MAFWIYRVAPKIPETVDFSGLCSDQHLSFFTLLDRASFPHYNNTNIIKFGWERFILWVISYGLSFRDLPDFQSSETRLMTASAHKLSEYCVQWSVYCQGGCVWSSWYCLTRIYNPDTSLALRFLCSWLNAGMCWRLCCWSCHNRASELWTSGKSRKWQSIRNHS